MRYEFIVSTRLRYTTTERNQSDSRCSGSYKVIRWQIRLRACVVLRGTVRYKTITARHSEISEKHQRVFPDEEGGNVRHDFRLRDIFGAPEEARRTCTAPPDV